MIRKIYNKCLSIILCSSLILSPAFAMNEQTVKSENDTKTVENNTKEKEKSSKFSYVKGIYNKLNKKYLAIGAFITTAALLVIIDRKVEKNRLKRLKQENEPNRFNIIYGKEEIDEKNIDKWESYKRNNKTYGETIEERRSREKDMGMKKFQDDAKEITYNLDIGLCDGTDHELAEQNLKRNQLCIWQENIYHEKGIVIVEKFFNFVKNTFKWRNKKNI